MKFYINNGTGQITLGMSEIGSYLKIADPVAVDWYDCAGSIGHYCCLLTADHALRETIRESIVSALNEDFSGNEERLFELLQPLFRLFKNGCYNLEFHESNHFFKPQFPTSQNTRQLFASLEILFPELSDATEEEKIWQKFQHFSEKSPREAHLFGLTGRTTSGYYPFSTPQFLIATRPENSLSTKQIQHYTDRISDGERPFVILLAGFYPNGSNIDFDTPYYILDGHHKLCAYRELNISPSICLITYYPETREEIEFDAEMLVERLLPRQAKHLIENWEDGIPYFREKMIDPKSPLYRVVKHGSVVDRYPNGQLIEKAYYTYGQIEGEYTRYYENGSVNTKGEYKDGNLIWQKHWDINGKQITFDQHIPNTSHANSIKSQSHHTEHTTQPNGIFDLFWRILLGILLVVMFLLLVWLFVVADN